MTNNSMTRMTRYTLEYFIGLAFLIAAVWLSGCSGPLAPSTLQAATAVNVPVVVPAAVQAVTPIAVAPAPPASSVVAVTSLHLQNRDTGRPVRLAEISADGVYLGTSDVSGNFVLTVGGAVTVYHGEYDPWHGTITLTGAVVMIALTPLR